jgi:hypothetical protein
MGSIEKSEEFPVEAEKLWEVVGNPARFEEWLSMHVKWKSDLPETIAVGTKLAEVVSVMNMPNTIEWTVEEYDVPSKIRLAGTGMAGVKVAIGCGVAPSASGSTLTISTTFEGQMLVGAIGAAVEKAGLADLDKSLAKLRELLG